MGRKTKQKEIILEELRKRKDHPKADQIYMAIKKKMPKISLGTVYRNLERFEEEGKVMKISEENFSRFDGNPEDHPHFVCNKCGRVFDIGQEISLNFNKEKLEEEGFEVKGEGIKIYGLCNKCKEVENDSN